MLCEQRGLYYLQFISEHGACIRMYRAAADNTFRFSLPDFVNVSRMDTGRIFAVRVFMGCADVRYSLLSSLWQLRNLASGYFGGCPRPLPSKGAWNVTEARYVVLVELGLAHTTGKATKP
jgi:hypothetical protein